IPVSNQSGWTNNDTTFVKLFGNSTGNNCFTQTDNVSDNNAVVIFNHVESLFDVIKLVLIWFVPVFLHERDKRITDFFLIKGIKVGLQDQAESFKRRYFFDERFLFYYINQFLLCF